MTDSQVFFRHLAVTICTAIAVFCVCTCNGQTQTKLEFTANIVAPDGSYTPFAQGTVDLNDLTFGEPNATLGAVDMVYYNNGRVFNYEFFIDADLGTLDMIAPDGTWFRYVHEYSVGVLGFSVYAAKNGTEHIVVQIQ